jgi:hypothetical protein
MEKWLLDNILELAVLLVGGVIAYIKLNRFQDEAIAWRKDFSQQVCKFEVDLKNHIESPAPHLVCPAHGAILQEIRGVLTTINERILAIDNRVFVRINGLEERIFELLKDLKKSGVE